MKPSELYLNPGDLAAVWHDGRWGIKEVMQARKEDIWLAGALGLGSWDWELIGPPF